MLFAIVQNNSIVQTIKIGKPFSFDGKDYNHKWSLQLSPARQAELGISEVAYGSRADERFYWVTEEGVSMVNGVPTLTYTSTPKDLAQLKAGEISKAKAQANSELAATDWMVIRKAERGVDIPAGVVAKRAAIVADCAAKEAAITAATSINELIDAITPDPVVITDSATNTPMASAGAL